MTATHAVRSPSPSPRPRDDGAARQIAEEHRSAEKVLGGQLAEVGW